MIKTHSRRHLNIHLAPVAADTAIAVARAKLAALASSAPGKLQDFS
jgi:hypothetical protein